MHRRSNKSISPPLQLLVLLSRLGKWAAKTAGRTDKHTFIYVIVAMLTNHIIRLSAFLQRCLRVNKKLPFKSIF